MNEDYSLLDIIRLVIKNWKKVMAVTAFAAVTSIVVALLKPNYYKAVTLFYPASQDLSKPAKIFGGDKKLEYFGTRTDLDRILTIAESREVYESLIQNFGLYKRYKIDSTGSKAKYKVYTKLRKLYKAKRTERDAVELSVEDRDPVVASKMANFARNIVEKQAAQMIKAGQISMIDKLKQTIESKSHLVKKLSDSLSYIRTQYSIFNQGAQSEFLSTEVAETESNLAENKAKLEYLKKQSFVPSDSIMKIQSKILGYEQKLNSLTKESGGRFNLQSLAKGIPLYNEIADRYNKELGQNNYNKLLLSQIEQIFQSNIPTIQLIEEATPPHIKSRPIRSLLVMASTVAGFVFGLLLVVVMSFWEKIKEHL